ncbi:MAG: lysophospholipid acyltransferase family protein [Acidobacteriota bacterium]|nr:lysophospholipid acyltransferase family protein [Acidobacteriota bacterium]
MNGTQEQLAAFRRSRGSRFTRLRSYCLFVPIVYLYTAVMGTLSLIASLFDGTGRIQHCFARTWARMILKTGFIRVKIEGLEHINPARSEIFASNHLSAVDIPVLYACLPVPFRILAKKELFKYPFLGWYLRRSGQIPIVYGDPHAALRSLNRASEALRKGMPFMVFPEGGRSATGQLQPFMGGAFYVAIRAQAPIVPITLVGTYEALPINSFHVLPGQVEMIIGEPIPTVGLRLRDMEKLAAQVRQIIADTYYSRAKLAQSAESKQQQSGTVLAEPGASSSELP